jgi:hypothetical protein
MKETRPIAAPDQWPRNSSNTTSAVPRFQRKKIFLMYYFTKALEAELDQFFFSKHLNSTS